jgi:hypothetical protein
LAAWHGGIHGKKASIQSVLGKLRRRSKITSAIPSGSVKNALFSGILPTITPARLLKLFLSAALEGHLNPNGSKRK